MARTLRGKRIQKRITGITPVLSQLANNGKIPEDEEGLRTLLGSLGQIDMALTESTGDLDKLRDQVLKRLSAFPQEQLDVVEHDVLPGAPVVIEQFADPIGDINLLMDEVGLTDSVISKLLQGICFDLIKQTKGLLPEFGVYDFRMGRTTKPRIVVKWALDRSARLADLQGIYEIAQAYYAQMIRGPKQDPSKGWQSTMKYQNPDGTIASKKNGIYFGPASYYDVKSRGVTVTRQFKRQSECNYLKERFPRDWMAQAIEGQPPQKFEVELREGEEKDSLKDQKNLLRQDEFISLVVQLAYFLKHGAFINRRDLAISVYRALNRAGAEDAEVRPCGLKEVAATIERVLLLPLQQPELARYYQFQPESILLTGVAGTGKTLLAKYLMHKNYNAIFASIHSDRLLYELIDPKGGQMLVQADKIGGITKLPVILLIDDVDAVVQGEEKARDAAIVSKFLNLLQGVRKKGFFLIASTNRPEGIDPRLLEPGRLSKVVHVPLPDESARADILDVHLKGMPFEGEQERALIIAEMAKQTPGWTGRYLRELGLEAARFCSLQLVHGDITAPIPESNEPLELTHFLEAKKLILAGVNMGKIKKRDQEIQDFVSQKGGKIGFGAKLGIQGE